ncbi:MAG TPA: bifunctional nuclease domain-containing protein [Candidatus Nanoarchaeia archaeon]|nr:bifunctional nuclease domain-containing protein [Candidatus Nanoarchaeia archaeon]
MMLGYKIRRFFRERGWLLFFICLAFAGGFSLVYWGSELTGLTLYDAQPSSPSPDRVLLADPFDLTDYTLVDVEAYAEGILFKHACQGFWIAMPYEKTFSIKRGEVGAFDIRPTQHDLMYDILTSYNITMHYARMERVEHNFYYATVLLEDDGKILQLDTRPSDALGLATRLKVPIYVSSKLLRQQGKAICDDTKT